MNENRLGCGFVVLLTGICVFMIPLMALFSGTINTAVLIVLPIGAAILALGIWLFIIPIKTERLRALAKNNIEFNVNTCELSLKRRAQENKSVVDYEQIISQFMNHHDTSLQYTSVTLGPKTVGQVQVVPEHYSMSKPYLTGKYNLRYTGYSKCYDVNFIKLTPELQSQAAKHPIIKRYLDANGEGIIPKRATSASDILLASTQSGKVDLRQDQAYNHSAYQTTQNALEKEEAKAIYKWIIGEI